MFPQDYINLSLEIISYNDKFNFIKVNKSAYISANLNSNIMLISFDINI